MMSTSLTSPKISSPLDVLRNYPLISFFTLANILSWLAWLPYLLSDNGIGIWSFTFPSLLGSSQFLGVLPGAYLGPIASALLITAVVDGIKGLRDWRKRLWNWKASPRWYGIVFLAVPSAMFVTGYAFSGGQVLFPSIAALLLFIPMLALQMVTTGLAEEPGWRDFALVRLQQRYSPLRAAFILGPLWGVWHLPLFLSDWGGYPEASWIRPVAFMILCIAFNVVMSWVFNGTGQSLPLSMLMHVGANTFASLMWPEIFPAIDEEMSFVAMACGAVVAAILVIIFTRGRLGYRELKDDKRNMP